MEEPSYEKEYDSAYPYNENGRWTVEVQYDDGIEATYISIPYDEMKKIMDYIEKQIGCNLCGSELISVCSSDTCHYINYKDKT
jgi:hypothetical protein